jgi:hypothetical protein
MGAIAMPQNKYIRAKEPISFSCMRDTDKKSVFCSTQPPFFMFHNLLIHLCLCLLSISVYAQTVPNDNFSNGLPVACPATGGTYNGFDEWSAFQTTDSSVWGPHDTSCFNIATLPFAGMSIDLGQTDPSLPLFVQARLDSTNMVLLDTNSLYRLTFDVFCQNGVPAILTGTNCPDDLCSGLSLGVEIPDSAGTGHTIRWYTGEITQNGSFLKAAFCFPTERFVNANFLRHTWWRLGQTAVNASMILENYSSYALENFGWALEKVSRIDAVNNHAYLGNQGFPGNNVLMMYTAPTYPDAQHLSYVEVFPSPNVASPQQITVEVPFLFSLNFQPYVQMRGGYVVGDTLRHAFTLLNNGGTLCGYNFVDLIFNGDDGYTHKSGKLDLHGPMACMSFGRGGTLRVADGATLQYGKPGNGMIAFRTGGNIEIGRQAELHIGGSLVIGEYHEELSPQSFEIHLKPGSKLTFAPGSHLRNFLSKFPAATYLDIYLEGGTLDDAGLVSAERALIRRHYTSLQAEFADNLQMLENPFSDRLAFAFTSRADLPLTIELLGLDGRSLRRMETITKAGNNSYQLETAHLPSGIYVLSLQTPYGQCGKKVVRQ